MHAAIGGEFAMKPNRLRFCLAEIAFSFHATSYLDTSNATYWSITVVGGVRCCHN